MNWKVYLPAILSFLLCGMVLVIPGLAVMILVTITTVFGVLYAFFVHKLSSVKKTASASWSSSQQQTRGFSSGFSSPHFRDVTSHMMRRTTSYFRDVN